MANTKKKKKKKWIIIPVILILGAGAVFGLPLLKGDSTAAENYYTAIPAGKNDLSKKISSSGKIIGSETVEVNTKLSAVVSKVDVSLGDYVKAGDEICVFDDSELREEYDTLKKQLETQEKQTESSHEKTLRDLEAAKAKKETALQRAQNTKDKAIKARDKAYADYNKIADRYNRGEETRYTIEEIDQMYDGLSVYDDAVTQAEEAYADTEAQYDEAIQSVQDILDQEEFTTGSDQEKQLKKLEEQLEQCVVLAPQNGIITAININEGSIPMASALVTIVNTDKTVVELSFRETEIPKLSEGMSAIVTSKVLPDEEMPAKITRILNVMSGGDLESEGGYKAEVTLDTAKPELLLGMSADVEIITEEVGEKMSLPYSGIVEEDGKSYVFVAEPDTEDYYTVRKVQVETGYSSDFFTEMKSGDVKEGDLIVEEPDGSGDLPAISDGERIKIK